MRVMVCYLFAILLFCLFLGGCQTTKPGSTSFKELTVPDTTKVVRNGDLRISPFDEIQVNVFGVSDFDGEHQVDFNGSIKMPLVGEIRAAGYTSLEFSKVIERRLGEKYLQNPDVSVLILSTSDEKLTVEGSVNKPGVYEIESRVSILQTLALAGGVTNIADTKRVLVVRTVKGERQAAVFDLKKVRSGETPDPVIYGNDIVVVDGSKTKQAYREFIASVPLLAFFRVF